MQPIHLEVEVRVSDGDVYSYSGEGVFDDIGKITRCVCRHADDTRVELPATGDVISLCTTYRNCGALSAALIVNRGETVYRDSTGQGVVGNVEGDKPRPETFANAVGLTMQEVATQICLRAGRSLFDVLGGNVHASETATITATCNSLIKLIIANPNYKLLELLHAQVPPASPPAPVLKYSMGGDIVHLFTRGQAVVNRTCQGGFGSVAVKISGENEWQAVVIPPQEFYQVLNTSDHERLEYFWLFLEHNNAFDLKRLHTLSEEESRRNGWGFVYSE